MTQMDEILKFARHPVLAAAIGLKVSRSARLLLALLVFALDAYTYYIDCWQTPAITLDKFGQCSGLVSSHFVVIRLLVLTANPLISVRWKSEGDIDPSKKTLLQRFERGANLSWNLRGIGLNNQIQYVPAMNWPTERWPFVFQQLFRLALHALRLAAIWVPTVWYKLHITLMANQPPAKTALEICFRRFFFTSVIIMTSFSIIDGLYTLVCIIGVASGYSSPEAWPSLFGTWRDGTTVRRSWGRYWHQMYRMPFMMMSDAIMNDALGVKKGTNLSSYSKLFITFTISGLMHAAGDFGMYHGARWFSLWFFVAQAVGITIEDIAIEMDKRWLGIQASRPGAAKLLGYLWVAVWFTATLPEFGAGFLPAIM
ncbi:hypothetical protein DL93DRAFT_2226051 [Clavulina sp. PMI_390]|nr:hypothetical protein DL93DRAFT_2226051 [Clavulina sp. PMI_390]